MKLIIHQFIFIFLTKFFLFYKDYAEDYEEIDDCSPFRLVCAKNSEEMFDLLFTCEKVPKYEVRLFYFSISVFYLLN